MSRTHYAFLTLLFVVASLVIFNVGAYVASPTVALVGFIACALGVILSLVQAIRSDD